MPKMQCKGNMAVRHQRTRPHLPYATAEDWIPLRGRVGPNMSPTPIGGRNCQYANAQN